MNDEELLKRMREIDHKIQQANVDKASMLQTLGWKYDTHPLNGIWMWQREINGSRVLVHPYDAWRIARHLLEEQVTREIQEVMHKIDG